MPVQCEASAKFSTAVAVILDHPTFDDLFNLPHSPGYREYAARTLRDWRKLGFRGRLTVSDLHLHAMAQEGLLSPHRVGEARALFAVFVHDDTEVVAVDADCYCLAFTDCLGTTTYCLGSLDNGRPRLWAFESDVDNCLGRMDAPRHI